MHFDAVVSEGVSKFKDVRMPGESSDRATGPKTYTYRELRSIYIYIDTES